MEAPTNEPSTEGVIFFAADGMRPDLMERYATRGFMPAYREPDGQGRARKNGLVQAFPPNTGTAGPRWPQERIRGKHGSTNNTFHRIGEGNFNNRTSAFSAGILQADTLQQAAERAGKTVVSVEWVGSRSLCRRCKGLSSITAPSSPIGGILLNYDLPGQTCRGRCFRRVIPEG